MLIPTTGIQDLCRTVSGFRGHQNTSLDSAFAFINDLRHYKTPGLKPLNSKVFEAMQNEFFSLALGLLHQRFCSRGKVKSTQSAACRALPSGTSCLAQTQWQADKLLCIVKQIKWHSKGRYHFMLPLTKNLPVEHKHPVELSLRGSRPYTYLLHFVGFSVSSATHSFPAWMPEYEC